MNTIRVIGLVVLIVGILILVYGGFSYTKESHSTDLGPVKLKFDEKERVKVPLWAGIICTAAGGALLVFGRSKR